METTDKGTYQMPKGRTFTKAKPMFRIFPNREIAERYTVNMINPSIIETRAGFEVHYEGYKTS